MKRSNGLGRLTKKSEKQKNNAYKPHPLPTRRPQSPLSILPYPSLSLHLGLATGRIDIELPHHHRTPTAGKGKGDKGGAEVREVKGKREKIKGEKRGGEEMEIE